MRSHLCDSTAFLLVITVGLHVVNGNNGVPCVARLQVSNSNDVDNKQFQAGEFSLRGPLITDTLPVLQLTVAPGHVITCALPNCREMELNYQ